MTEPTAMEHHEGSRFETALVGRLNAIVDRVNGLLKSDDSGHSSNKAHHAAEDIRTLLRAIMLVLHDRDCFRNNSAHVFINAAAEWKARRRKIESAFCLGQSSAYRNAAELLDEALVEAFDLWAEYEADVSCRIEQSTAEDGGPAS